MARHWQRSQLNGAAWSGTDNGRHRGSRRAVEPIRDDSVVVRVGFNRSALPFSFLNSDGALVGLGIQLTHRLARDLGASLEFVPYEVQSLVQQLESDHFDIAVGQIGGTAGRYEQMLLTDAYLHLTPGLVVADHRRHELGRPEEIRQGEGLRFGVIGAPGIVRAAGEYLPDAELVPLASWREFFEDSQDDLDGLLITAETGSAWTLIYPDYEVVSPVRDRMGLPVAFPVVGRDFELVTFMNHWLEMKQADGTLERAYDYWILGRSADKRGSRWSVVRDVLHWVD